MIKFLQNSAAAFILLLLATSVSGQDFSAVYTFTNASNTPGSGRTDPTPVPIVSGLTFGSFAAVAPGMNPHSLSANPNASARFSFTGWPLGATNNTNTFTGSIDTDQYYEVTITPQVNSMLSLDSINFIIQRSGTGIRQYAVRSSIDGFTANLPAGITTVNPSLEVVENNIFQISDASTTAQEGSRVILSEINNSTTAITLRFYGWNSEASSGTFSIDNVVFNGTVAPVPGSPVLSISEGVLNFSPIAINTSSSVLSVDILGENLLEPVVISTTAPFSFSDLESGDYGTTLNIAASEVVVSKTIYIKFNPTSIGGFSGTMNLTSGTASKNILLSGEGIDPSNLIFNFNDCSASGAPGSGFTAYSVNGSQRWACSNFGNNSTKGVDVNGFSGSALDNEDWLISPSLLIGSLNLPILSFYSRGEFTGPSLQLLISTDYDGTSNPNSANWTDLQATFPPLTNLWTFTDGINLSAYKSFSKVYIAFKYTSIAELGAARWTVDDVSINDRTKLLSVSPGSFNFGEIAAENNSAAQAITLQSIGYGDVSLTAPAGYQLSTDNTTFSATIMIDAATAESGTIIYSRFSPVFKALKFEGKIHFSGTGLDSNLITLTGTSYPKAETFDIGAYNISFFGSNSTNNPTPQKITTQINNIATVFRNLNLDVIGIEELSSDSALGVLISQLPNYASVVSDRWSYSFDPPDPAFPPQKVGFIYNSSTMQLVESRVMFQGLYDSARNGTSSLLDNYPTGTASSFWASGRLPFMATFNVTIGGITRLVRLIDIHAKSASDAESYRRRVYDIKVLKDSLDAYYKNDNIVLIGDYNDRVIGSINVGATSPYKIFVDDNVNYAALTFPLDQAGRVSFISGTAMIDHIIISNELQNDFIASSADIEDPRAYISGYNANTASDHLAVFSRFLLKEALPVELVQFNAEPKGKTVMLSWSTVMEYNNSHFIIERSADGKHFEEISRVNSKGNSNFMVNYQIVDPLPLKGVSYYRLKQIDADGRQKISEVLSVTLGVSVNNFLRIYPNPVGDKMMLNFNSTSSNNLAQVLSIDGKVLVQVNGSIGVVSEKINLQLPKLKKGTYVLKIINVSGQQSVTFIKK